MSGNGTLPGSELVPSMKLVCEFIFEDPVNQPLNTKTASAGIWQQERGADAADPGISYVTIKLGCFI